MNRWNTRFLDRHSYQRFCDLLDAARLPDRTTSGSITIRMESYKSGSPTVWDCKYHLICTTKYRYQVLVGDVGLRCRELLREIARSKEMMIYAGSIKRDHVHLLIGIPPNLSVSKALQYLKGKSSHRLPTEYAVLRKRYWGQHLWGRGYWVASCGNVTDEVCQEYIKNQTPPEPDDDFPVV